MNSVVILQARTNSSRLPAKVMLPIAGYPMVVLAAKRAANTGRNVLVAISDESSDDALADLLTSYNIAIFRGSLNNVLNRFLSAVHDCSDETILVRITADNVFPDGQLIDAVEASFLKNKFEYLSSTGSASGLPYGMSVEVTRVGHLREAAECSSGRADMEHVTPFVIRKFGASIFTQYQSLRKGHYRCTIDTLDDYLNVCRVFAGIDDPVSVESLELIDRLKQGRFQPECAVPTTDLVLGTAQLGMDYGIANSHGCPSLDEAREILKTAIGNGVRYIDTAKVYGSSERVIGRCLGDGWLGRSVIITKLDPLDDCSSEASGELIQSRVCSSVYESCVNLGSESLDVLMLHRARHLWEWGGAVWAQLQILIGNGVIGKLGVSVQTPEELERVLKYDGLSIIQLPFNLFDYRWDELVPEIINYKNQYEVTIHVRSALLQGLLTSHKEELWFRAGVQDSTEIRNWLESARKRYECEDIVSLCLRYARSQSWVDGVVVGVEKLDQLQANIRCFEEPLLSSAEVAEIVKSIPVLPEQTLNPSKWKAS